MPTLARHATITLYATGFHTICFLDPLLNSPAHSAKIAPHKFRGSRCSETHICEIPLRCTHTINTKPNVLHELHCSHVTVSTRSFAFFFFFFFKNADKNFHVRSQSSFSKSVSTEPVFCTTAAKPKRTDTHTDALSVEKLLRKQIQGVCRSSPNRACYDMGL